MAEKPEQKPEFVMPGEHPADAFINDVLLKKFPGIEDKATAFMELQRQQGDQNYSANPLATMLVALRDKAKPDMPYEEFVTKFRERALKAMEKHKVKPYSVDVGEVKVVEPPGGQFAITAGQILKTIVSPAWDGVVGTMRVAASPLADLPENQDPAQREAIRRGLMKPLSEVERKKGQVEVLTGLLGIAAAGQVGADIGAAKAGASHVSGAVGYIKNVIEGGAWGAAFGAAHGAGQEEAAEEILAEAQSGMTAGALLVGGLSLAGRTVGAGLRKYRGWKLEKLLKDIDAERGVAGAHMGEMKVPDALAELMPDGGLAATTAAPPRGSIPANTKRFTNITMPEEVRASLSPEKVAFLQRADKLMTEKGIRMDYATGELTATLQAGTGVPAVQIPAETTARLRAEAPVNVLPSGTRTIHLPAGMEADASKEISYRLVYGDRVFSEKAAEYDILPQEVKAKIDFWTYLDKTEGTPAAQFMRNLERSAKTRLNARASRRRGTAFDVTAASLEGAYDLTDAAVIGAAKLYRLSHLAPEMALKLWDNEMLQVLGDTASARSALHRVYLNSQKQLEKMLGNMAPEMHDVRALMEKYEQGTAGMDWYTNAYAELERMYGREDARLMAHLLAINSTGTNVDMNVLFALRDFAALKAGLPPKGGRFPTMQKKMISEMLQGRPYGDQKVKNFVHLLLGGTGHAVNDIQVARSIGWVRDKFSKNQYRFVDEVIRGLAKDAGVSAEQYQAALWTTPRIAKAQEAMAGGDKRALAHVASFRTYPEHIRVDNARQGIKNTLVTPADEGGGGYTFNPVNMHAWKGKGYLTTLTGEVVAEQALTPGAILKFVDKIRPLLKQYQKSGVEFTVGLWKKGDGTVSIDLNLVTPSKEQALAIGRRTDQFAVGDMTTGSYEGDIPTGKAPESSQRKVALPEVKRILKELLGGKL